MLHVAARTVATHALSIFGDHSDVMAARTTGFAMLCASSVQEAHDFALVAHAATLRSRVPFLHFFDGFRTSHEIARVELLEDADLAALIDEDAILAHRARRMTPDAPTLRGTAQNPDVFFQAREACQPVHDAVPGVVEDLFAQLAARTGRRYGLADYVGDPEAERVLVLMGSGAGAAEEAVELLATRGESRRAREAPPVPSLPRRRPRRRDPARARAPSPCSTEPRSPAPPASRSTRTWSRRSSRSRRRAGARCRASAAGATAWRRRSSRPRW